MLPASNKGVGMNTGFPDVCRTMIGPAPVPIPYPNIGMNAVAAPFSPNIFLTMMPALNMGSLIPMTSGDEPGAANVIFKMVGGWKMGNPKVLANCLPAINLTCQSYGNMMNNAVGAALVPSVTNVLLTYQTEESPLEVAERVAPARVAHPILLERGSAGARLVIGTFTSDAAARVHSLLRGLASDGVTALTIDLRGCPGGDLYAALDLASEFLPNGVELGRIVDSDGDESIQYGYRSYPWAFALTLLTDARTASAAEVFAGVLRHYRRAEIVGERTYGKGSCQRLQDGRLLTVGECLLPGGQPISGRGIEPLSLAAGPS
jgi:carboxyl-terminal processing protease